MTAPQDEVFSRAWNKALEEYGTNARINNVWEFSSKLEKALEQENK